MRQSYRSLTPEFRHHFDRLDLFPTNPRYIVHMAEHYGGISGGVLTDLKAGAAVADKAALGLVSMIRWSDLAKPGSREALDAYLQRLGIEHLDEADDEDIVSVICGPTLDRPRPADGHTDYLQLGVRAVKDFMLSPKRSILRHSRPCSPSEVDAAVNWVHLLIASHAADRDTREQVTLCEARPFAEEWMGITGAEYADRLRGWITENPKTVRLALGRKLPVGVTAVAPLRPEAYEAVRAGEVASYDCSPGDLLDSSRDILIEAVAERVAEERAEPLNPTLAMLMTLQLQLAHLTAIDTQPDDAVIRILSFAGTDLSQRRLAKQGFKAVGTKAARSGVDMMEREFHVGSLKGIEAITAMIWRWMDRSVPID
jgi:hypothetical protein